MKSIHQAPPMRGLLLTPHSSATNSISLRGSVVQQVLMLRRWQKSCVMGPSYFAVVNKLLSET